MVSTSPSITPVFGTQSGEVESKGGELEFVARIHDQLSINGSYSYTRTEVLASGTLLRSRGLHLRRGPAGHRHGGAQVLIYRPQL